MVLGRFETRSFSFMVLAENEKQAQEAMQKAWEIHCREYEADPTYYEEFKDDLCITDLPGIPCMIRDGAVLEERNERI